jgi:uncharacterized protein YecE (DUF72 family)
MADLEIGCSGFSYSHWRGGFYPEKMPQKEWFHYYCSIFSTVELNVTFYRLPEPSTFEKWHKETPDDFVFSLKGSRYITHIKRIKEPEESLKIFFNNASKLKKKLRTVLWQFPPSFKADIERLHRFLRLLKKYPVRNTLEFRNESWITEETVSICKEFNVSLCMADSPDFVNDLPVTAGFVYIRRHGKESSRDTCYSKIDIKRDAERIKKYLKTKRDVFIYFNNDAFGCAPKNAQELIEQIRVK